MVGQRKKNFVLDTNVALYSPRCLDTFENNNIYIPAVVLEELDKLKTNYDTKGYNAREFIRKLEILRKSGNLVVGVALSAGGKLHVRFYNNSIKVPDDFSESKNDNYILGVALEIKDNSKEDTILVSKDVNLRIKANVLGLHSEDYYHDKSNETLILHGDTITTKDSIVDELYLKNKLLLKEVPILNDTPKKFVNNDYCLIKSIENEKKSALIKIKNISGANICEVIKTDIPILGINPINYRQKFLLNALVDPSIKVVFAIGIAGTGKTLLSIGAGLTLVLNKEYKKMVATRSPVPMGRDIGYLPGKISEKMDPWLKPIYDNLEFIVDQLNDDNNPVIKEEGLLKKHMNEITMEYLKATNIIEIESLTFIRGRTFSDTFLIVDEAQNLTPHEAKTIISRIGKNSKIVLTGDPFQIDNPYLDERDNGLVYSSEKFKLHNSSIATTIYLDRCERSELAQQAADFL